MQSGSRNVFKTIAALPRPVLIGIGALLCLVVLTMIIDSGLFYNKVHAGVSVAGQGLGGQTYDQATGLLDKQVEKLRSQPITVVSGSRTWTVTPDDVGQVIDFDASVNAAMQVTRRSNLIADLARRLKLYFSGDNVPLVGQVDQGKFDAFMASISGALDQKPVNQGLSIQGETIDTVQGMAGYVVDQDKLEALLTEALFAHDLPQIQVPMMSKAPDVVAANSDQAIAQVRTMISGNVTLAYLAPVPTPTTSTTVTSGKTTASTVKASTTTVQQTTTTTEPESTTTTILETSQGKLPFIAKTKTFTPSEIQDLLDYKAGESNGVQILVPYVSAEKLKPFLSAIEGPMAVPAVDASFDTDGSSCWVVPGKEGQGLDHEATAAALTAAALRTDNRTATAVLKNIDPDLTTDKAKAMGITDRLGYYKTSYDRGTPEREYNVALATKKVSNVYLAPGEEYDFAKTLGPRTADAGFELAPGIVDGALEDVYGGGICQVSTTFFNAVLEAGLKITERWNHSYFIDHYPAGRDATITGGGNPKDFKFVNDTKKYLWIWGLSDGTDTEFTIFGTSDGRRVTTLDVSLPYDVLKSPGGTVTLLDPSLPWGATSVSFKGQDGFKLRLTRVITWPNGSTTSETWVSQWRIKAGVIMVPTSTTTTLPGSSGTPTPTASPPGS